MHPHPGQNPRTDAPKTIALPDTLCHVELRPCATICLFLYTRSLCDQYPVKKTEYFTIIFYPTIVQFLRSNYCSFYMLLRTAKFSCCSCIVASQYEGPAVSPPENFSKLRCLILHSADYLLWNFLLFENIVGPQPKSWGPVSPGPYGCCAYVVIQNQRSWC